MGGAANMDNNSLRSNSVRCLMSVGRENVPVWATNALSNGRARSGRLTCRERKSVPGRGMEYITEIVSFIVGAIAGGFAVKVHYTRNSVDQSRNTVGGDMAGRDINKR